MAVSVLADIVATCGTIIVLGGAYAVMRPLARRISNFLSDFEGEPARAGVPERPGLMVRMERLEERLAKVDGHLVSNGGGSVRDAIDRIELNTHPG